MKNTLSLLIIALFLANCHTPSTQEKGALTNADYLRATKHLGRYMNPLVYDQIKNGWWTQNGNYIYRKSIHGGHQFVFVDISTKHKKSAFDHERLAKELSKLVGEQYTASTLPFTSFDQKEGNYIDFTCKGKSYRCDLNTYALSENKDKSSSSKANEVLSPNGKLAAFIKDYNLWVRNVETNLVQQLTFDGKKDYGYATNNAGWTKSDKPVLAWSPNSDKIATFRQDARGVKEMYLTSTNVGHPKLEAWKHPLPGDSIVFKIERIIIEVTPKAKIIPLNIPPDFQRSTTTDHIAGRNGELLDVQWKDDGTQLAFISSSRDHKIAHLQIADAQSGNVTSILKEHVDTYYESGVKKENWHVLFDSNEVIWFSERDNWGHLYLYDIQGNLKHQITKGEWAVQQLLHIDPIHRELRFTAGGKESGNPYHKYLYKIGFDGANMITLTPDTGDHRVIASPDWTYFIDTYSTTNTPPISVVRDLQGTLIMSLEKANIDALKAANWQQPIEFTVKARDHKTDLYGLLYLPSSYDAHKSYPVLNYIYPGPQTGSISDYSFKAARRDFQAVAELGFIVMAVDAMGTPGRSKSFHDAYYGNMGDNGLPDNITAIKQLAAQYKGMDTTRVGIWGHSGGGFASTRALFQYPNFYDVAVSGSGNHDNRNYEADWGEKWHGLLTYYDQNDRESNGSSNYDSQANQLLAKNLKGHLLITHGSMDDNVHPSNTMLVVEELIRANKDFDMIIFPNKRHGYGDMTNYMTRKRWDYFVTHLLGVDPPKEFSLDEF
ncbi:S9 family peptidase [Flavobacteriaceae bacterium F08102]|nr:S9 family peptidase [Flavobacteriaceae bacterium F08102]